MSSKEFELQVEDLRRATKIATFRVKWFNTVKDIKLQLQEILQKNANRMQLFRTFGSSYLSNHSTLQQIGVDEINNTLLLSLQFAQSSNFVEPLHGLHLDAASKDMLAMVRQGITNSQIPTKTDEFDCTGGAYFFKAANGGPAAVFKPNDEEQGMPCNGKGHAGTGKEALRPHFSPGEGCNREFAAYLFDYENFSNVPPTTLVYCEHNVLNYPTHNTRKVTYPKLGSLQQFIRASDTFEDIGPSLISTFELQKIALFDMRVLNADRNASNILAVRKTAQNSYLYERKERKYSRAGSEGGWSDYNGEDIGIEDFLTAKHNDDMYVLVPIDHGYAFPTKLCIEDFDWAWFGCSHIKKPVDPVLKEYFNSIRIDDLLNQLREQAKIPEESLFLLKIVHSFLLKGINNGLTLYELACQIARTTGEPSDLEKLIQNAEDNATKTWEVKTASLHYSEETSHKRGGSPPARTKSPSTMTALATVTSPHRPGKMTRSVRSEVSLSNHDQKKNDKKRTLSIGNPPNIKLDEEDYYLKDIGNDSPSKPYSSMPPSMQNPDSLPEGISNKTPFSPVYLYDAAKGRAAVPTFEQFQQRITIPSVHEASDMDVTSSESSSSEFGTSPKSLDPFFIINHQQSVFHSLLHNEKQRALPKFSEENLKKHSEEAMSDGRVRKHETELDSFAALEVQIEQPLKDHSSKTIPKVERRRQRSASSDGDGDAETDTMSIASSSSDFAFEGQPISFCRVVSFGAFESPPLYDIPKDPRIFERFLKREKRAAAAKSDEYVHIRERLALEFVHNHVMKMAGKKAKAVTR